MAARGSSPPRRFGSVRNSALAAARVSNGKDITGTATETASVPDPPLRGPSTGTLGSAALIARMRARQGNDHPRNKRTSSLAASGVSDRSMMRRSGEESGVYHDADALMARIVSFLEASGGQTASNLLVEKFRDEVG